MVKRLVMLLTAALFLFSGVATAEPAQNWTSKNSLQFLGHSAFVLKHGDVNLVFDPYLTGNPWNVAGPEDIDATYILVSHAHQDHLGDTTAIAKRTGAKVITTAELARMLREQGCDTIPMHIGGKKQFDFGYVKITPAVHGSGVAGGYAAGFIVNFYGTTVYFAGDTALFGDMALIGKQKIDYAILPIGDNYTMGVEDAVEAVGLLKPKAVIPMHYNTHELIKQSPEEFKRLVENRFNIPVLIMQPGGILVL